MSERFEPYTLPRLSDEEMFAAVEHVTYSPHMPAEVFTCTVGAKPSKAPFYLDDPSDVVDVLRQLGSKRPR